MADSLVQQNHTGEATGRPIYKTVEFVESHQFRCIRPQSKPEAFRRQLRGICKCNRKKLKQCLFSAFPFVNVMKTYKWKAYLPNDILAGLTVAIMQLPQGMAYAMIAEMPAVVGLYMGFFPVLCYALLGTSRHLSMGAIVVVSLMFGALIDKHGLIPANPISAANQTWENSTASPLHTLPFIQLATSLTVVIGILQFFLGLVRMGLIVRFLSDSIIGAFSTGIAVHVIASQLKNILGLRIRRFSGIFKVPYTIYEVCANIQHTNYPELLMCLVALVILYLVKVQINERFKSSLRVPVPIDLIIVILSTAASYFLRLSQEFNFRIVGSIPVGLPTPAVPSLFWAWKLFGDVITITIVALVQTISISVLIAREENYEIDANQELMASGIANIVGSFFCCYTAAAAISRTSVQLTSGGKTQMASLFGCAFVFVVIMALGPLFEPLPNCILSAVIIISLRKMFLEMFQLGNVWKISKHDFIVWVVTFLGVVLTTIELGLVVGIGISILLVIVRTQRGRASVLGMLENTEIFLDRDSYKGLTLLPGIRVIAFDGPVYFANADIFVEHVYNLSGIRPEQLIQKQKLADNDNNEASIETTVLALAQSSEERSKALASNVEGMLGRERNRSFGGASVSMRGCNLNASISDYTPYTIIIDCSGISFVDGMGIKTLRQLYENYSSAGVTMILTNVREQVVDVMRDAGLLETFRNKMYLSTYDAVLALSAESPMEIIEGSDHQL